MSFGLYPFAKKTGRVPKRSPIRRRPLRVAGQSLDETIQRVLQEDTYETLGVVVVFVSLAIWEWFRVLYPKPQPLFVTIVAFAGSIGAVVRLLHVRRTIRNLRLARDGERAVADILDQMRENGYRIFHDIVGSKFNADHVLIGSHGLYVIETKTMSKPAAGGAKITYSGESIRVGGFRPQRDPVQQASALAQWISESIETSTGRTYPVRPVILYPGWFVEDTFTGPRPHVWVEPSRAAKVCRARARTPPTRGDPTRFVMLVAVRSKRNGFMSRACMGRRRRRPNGRAVAEESEDLRSRDTARSASRCER